MVTKDAIELIRKLEEIRRLQLDIWSLENKVKSQMENEIPSEDEFNEIKSAWKDSEVNYTQNPMFVDFIDKWTVEFLPVHEDYFGYQIKRREYRGGYFTYYVFKNGEMVYRNDNMEKVKAHVNAILHVDEAIEIMKKLGLYDLTYESRAYKRNTLIDRTTHCFKDEMAISLQKFKNESKRPFNEWEINVIKSLSSLDNNEFLINSRSEQEFSLNVGAHVLINDGKQAIEWGVR